jgi:ABC-type multidrug transport system ATPase subunit
LEIAAGSIVGLIGANGAGKSTLLRIAAGLLAPTSGTVWLQGCDPYRERGAPQRALGALIERPGLHLGLSLRETLLDAYGAFAPPGEGRAALRRAVEAAIDAHALREIVDTPVQTLSVGWRQRVALARAMHPWATVLLLDEPLDGLDPAARHRVKELVRERQRAGAAVLFSSHLLADLATLADRAVLLSDGRLHAADDILADAAPALDPDAAFAALTRRASGAA